METETKLNSEILKTTMKIEEKFPELTKYIEEMPVKISDDISPESTIENLKDYHESLTALLKKYSIDHYAQSKN